MFTAGCVYSPNLAPYSSGQLRGVLGIASVSSPYPCRNFSGQVTVSGTSTTGTYYFPAYQELDANY